MLRKRTSKTMRLLLLLTLQFAIIQSCPASGPENEAKNASKSSNSTSDRGSIDRPPVGTDRYLDGFSSLSIH